MRRLVVAVLAVAAILATTVASVSAAPGTAATEEAGPYEGTFYGTAHGDDGSSAPLLLALTHRGSQVEGIVYIGEGLYVSGGLCGQFEVPATAQYVQGQTQRWNPKRLVINPTFEVGGYRLTVDFESNVSSDGETITAEAKVDLPWLCGRDPVLTGTLEKY